MVFLRRWRPQKLAQQGDQQLFRARSLFENRGNELYPHDRIPFKDRLTYASDLRHGLENGTYWKRLKQARLFSKWVEETLDILERMLPDPPIQTGPLRRPINLL